MSLFSFKNKAYQSSMRQPMQAREHINVGVMFMVGDVPGIAKEQNRVQQNAKTSCSHCYAEGTN